MNDIHNKICALDTNLFHAIESQTNEDDRKSLLLLQKSVRGKGPYVYLEIGSYLGGSLQPYYVDPLCTLIYSIDKRTLLAPDERGKKFEYPGNTSITMLSNLKAAYPGIAANKIQVFEGEAPAIDPALLLAKPNICFIDGEHINATVFNDFKFCLEVCQSDIIALHDTPFIFGGIKRIKAYLQQNALAFKGILLKGSVYVFLLNGAIEAYFDELKPFQQNETRYFKKAT